MAFTALRYEMPAAAAVHRITGLRPGEGYSVTLRSGGDRLQVEVLPGGDSRADSGGVLVIDRR